MNTVENEVKTLRLVIQDLEQERSLKDQFVCSLSHDILTPLNASKLCAQLLMRNNQDKLTIPKNKRLFDILIDELDRANRMINEFLDVNKMTSSEEGHWNLHECCLDELARKSLGVISATHEKADFTYQSTGNVRGMWCEDAIHRMLENLVVNALKYGDQRSPISVTLKEREDCVALTVRNFGNPIEKEYQEKIFEAFQRSAQARESTKQGWGLGLSLVNTVVRKHGGSIHLTSTEEAGTSFEVTLKKNFLS